MPSDHGHSQRRLSVAISQSFADIPSWARGLLFVGGLSAAVVLTVSSLEGGKDYTLETDKVLHFGGYATLALLFVMAMRPVFYLPTLVILALLGFAIEVLQPFNSRTSDIFDAVANVVGLAAGTVLGLILRVIGRVIATLHNQKRLQKQRRVYARGSVITRQGVVGQHFYVIEAGDVELSREVDGQKQVLARMSAGDVFGLLGVLQSKPQYATVEALTETTLITLGLNDLFDPNDKGRQPVEAVMKCMAKHLQSLADRVIEAETTAT